MFNPSTLESIEKIDTIYSTSAQYNDPTPGYLDLLDLDQLSKPVFPVNITVYDIEGQIGAPTSDVEDRHKVLELTVEEYSTKNVLYISDVWISEKYRGVGLGTELFEFLQDDYPEFDIYVYASSVPMATVARNIGSDRVDNNWYKL